MTQRLFDVNKWTLLEEGKVLRYPSAKPREVKLEVNAPGDSELSYVSDSGEVKFLALVRGRDRVEFHTDGRFGLTVQGNDCYIYTVDGIDISTTILDPVIFTRIVERRARNPEFVAMELRMMQNIQRRLDSQKHELVGYYERRERYREQELANARLAADAPEQPGKDDRADTPDTSDPGDDG